MTYREGVNRFKVNGTLDLKLLEKERSSLKIMTPDGIDYYQLVNTAIFPKELQFQNEDNE